MDTKIKLRNQVKSDVNKLIFEDVDVYNLYKGLKDQSLVYDISGYNLTRKYIDNWIILINSIGRSVHDLYPGSNTDITTKVRWRLTAVNERLTAVNERLTAIKDRLT